MKKIFKTIWKKFWRPILRSPIVRWILTGLAAGIIWFIYLTSKRRIKNFDTMKQCRHKPAIFVFFHGRCSMLSPLIKSARVPGYCVASRHKDGRMMACLQRYFGLRPIYGSTSEGAVAVLRQGIRLIKEKNAAICISVDGPSGPSLRLQDGALYFARMTGAPIIPCCFSASRAKMLNKWDRFLIPKLFGTITFDIGNPIYVDSSLKGDAFEQKRQEVENIMIKQLRDMDAEFNLFPVEYGITASEFKELHKKK